MKEHTTDKYIYVLINKNARKVLNPDKIWIKCASDQTPTLLPWVGRVNSIYECIYISFGEVAWRTVVWNMVHLKMFSFLFIGYVLEAVVAASDSGSLADLAKILSQLAGGDNCVFRCPRGKLSYFTDRFLNDFFVNSLLMNILSTCPVERLDFETRISRFFLFFKIQELYCKTRSSPYINPNWA